MHGAICEYADLRAVIKARRQELGLSQLEVDERSGVQSGYTAKIECGMKHFGDVSLGPILAVLGIVLSATKQSETRSETASKIAQREKTVRKIRGRNGGKQAAQNMTADERRARARKAAKSRWRNWRAMKVEKERKAKRIQKVREEK